MPTVEREATRIVKGWLAHAEELEQRELGPEAEQLRIQAGAMFYAQPELFFHHHMDTPARRVKRPGWLSRTMRAIWKSF